jgi:uncharacterized membrane protein YtjA (UPF0391 family)
MLGWTLAFLLVAMLAGILGFGVVAVAFAALAKAIFYIAVVLFLVSLFGHFMRHV